ncbi:MAG TPA: AMP nucleosidase, partial [Caulobacteraceae bacterium]|nr:AMP nucleosidase [Caulobacteraceae bacterium]
MNAKTRARAVVAQLDAEYRRATGALRSALKDFMRGGVSPDPALRAERAFTYPELRLTYLPTVAPPKLARSYARFSQPGVYAVTVTRPDLFADYLTEQLSLILEDFETEVAVGRSDQEIPFPYVLDADDAAQADVGAAEIARHFPTTELAHIGDEVTDGFWSGPHGGVRPLALFDALRTDFSLARIAHYTGAPPEHVQSYLLFTNYHRYVDEFVRIACA